MYYNNRCYFSRPEYGYAYGNPYRLNFSRIYPRVLIGQNFSVKKEPGFLQRHPWVPTLGGAILGGALLHGIITETDLGNGLVEKTTRRLMPIYLAPVTFLTDKLPDPIDTYVNTAIGAGAGGTFGYLMSLPEENGKRSRTRRAA